MPLRILHIINSLGLGGAESLLYRVVTSDSANEHIVVSLGRPAWYSPLLEKRGVTVFHLDMSPLRGVAGGIRRLNRIVRESGADVVQCWMYRSNLLGGLVAQAAGKPVVWGIHHSTFGTLKPSSRALVRVTGLASRWNPDFIVNCSSGSADFHRKLGYPSMRAAVVHNGYDSSKFFPREEMRFATRKLLGIEPHEFAIGSIGRWHAQKDIPNLLRASRIARDRGIRLRCFLFGVGLDRKNPSLADEIERAGVGDFVVPGGPRSDIDDVARALDLHVLASADGEAFPNVVAETMLSGTPNVVTDVGDSALMVGTSGWVVPPRDSAQLADAIVQAYGEWQSAPEQWSLRRDAARTRIADNFSFDRMVAGYEDVWRNVSAGKRRARASRQRLFT